MDFSRRLKLYGLGIIIGGVCSWFIFGQRLLNSGWTPQQPLQQQNEEPLVKASPLAQAQLAAWPAEVNAVREAVAGSEVLLSETRRAGDSLFYTMEAVVKDRPARIVVSVREPYERDTSAVLMRITPR